jgi:hypothetical protein
MDVAKDKERRGEGQFLSLTSRRNNSSKLTFKNCVNMFEEKYLCQNLLELKRRFLKVV